MTKREIIIVLLATVATLYGIYTYVYDDSLKRNVKSVNSGKEIQEANELVVRASELLKEEDSSTITEYIVSLAEKKWLRDPFVREGEVENKAQSLISEKERSDNESFVYAGYLELGKRKVAVINGFDYEEGEEVESSGFFVEKVKSSEVILYDGQRKRKLIIPFVGE